MTALEFSELRYGMFVHYGLFSRLARGEWVMNREQISVEEIRRLGKEFDPEAFDAEALCQLAEEGGMKYIILTTMHHEGFRLYDTALSDFNSKNVCGRDLVSELVTAARKHNLKIGLYHSLNNWTDQPDAVAALENKADYEKFISNTFARLKELVTKYAPFDILWYDGWWPFNSEGWQGVRMNEEMRKIQPHLLFNGRNGLPGDFGTPEQHLTAPSPWRPWEGCMTLNDHWGYHAGDENWKSPLEVVKMLLTVGAGRGNLLLNIGPRGDGSVPEKSVQIVRQVGQWLRNGGAEAIASCDPMPLHPELPQPGDRGDWDPQGRFTASGNSLYFTLLYDPGDVYTLTGLQNKVLSVAVKGAGLLEFSQTNSKLVIKLSETVRQRFAPVLEIKCDTPAAIYRTGGMRIPKVEHPRYDPVAPDIQY